jgi:hypothetical protein
MHMHKLDGGRHAGSAKMVMAPVFMLFFLLESLFWAGAATCFLYAINRIAGSLKMQARIKALDKYGDAFTVEEREVLISKVKHSAMSM